MEELIAMVGQLIWNILGSPLLIGAFGFLFILGLGIALKLDTLGLIFSIIVASLILSEWIPSLKFLMAFAVGIAFGMALLRLIRR